LGPEVLRVGAPGLVLEVAHDPEDADRKRDGSTRDLDRVVGTDEAVEIAVTVDVGDGRRGVLVRGVPATGGEVEERIFGDIAGDVGEGDGRAAVVVQEGEDAVQVAADGD